MEHEEINRHWKTQEEEPLNTKEYFGEFCTPDEIPLLKQFATDYKALAASYEELKDFDESNGAEIMRLKLAYDAEVGKNMKLVKAAGDLVDLIDDLRGLQEEWDLDPPLTALRAELGETK